MTPLYSSATGALFLYNPCFEVQGRHATKNRF
jgi:hypothetical protein